MGGGPSLGKGLLALAAVTVGVGGLALIVTGAIDVSGGDDDSSPSSSSSPARGASDTGPPGLACDAPGARELDESGSIDLRPVGGGEASGSVSTLCLDDELTLVVNTSDLPSRASGEYAIWLFNRRRGAVRLGAESAVSGAPLVLGRVSIPRGVNPSRYRYLDISYQPREGSRRHSGRSELRARLP